MNHNMVFTNVYKKGWNNNKAMTGNELFEEYCNEYPLIQGYREVSYESWLQQQVVEYRTQVVNKTDLLPDVSWRSELLKAFVEWQIQGNTPYAGMLIDEHIRAYFKSL